MKISRMYLRTVNADQAEEMIGDYQYDRQRNVSPQAVGYYAEMMEKGEWLPGSEIDIAFCKNGDGAQHGYLVNGRHRLLAVIKANAATTFAIKEYGCDDREEVDRLYGLLDTGRSRSIIDYVNAVAGEGEMGLNRNQIRNLGAAVAFTRGNFGYLNKYHLTPGERIELMQRYAAVAKDYFALLAGATNTIEIPMRRASSMSVALVTLEQARPIFGEDKVNDFWKGIALNDGLRVGDPRKVAFMHMIESKMRGGSATGNAKYTSAPFSARYIANCFNAWVENRPLTFTRVSDASAPISIAGTSFRGK